MIKIEIKSNDVTPRNVNVTRGKNAGQVMHFREQEAWAFTYGANGSPMPYPQRIVLTLDDNQPPYPVGHYAIAPQSVYVGDFNRLAFGRLQLTPLAASARAAA